MKVAVIGAGGFVGQRVVRLLEARADVTEIRALDRAGGMGAGKVRSFVGDFSDATLRDEVAGGADAVIHLAAILGGAAESNPALARRVNIDATLDLIDRLKGTDARFVFASTIAVYGGPLPDPVTDDTPLDPILLYGAQKLMVETALTNCARRGWLDAVSLRPAGVMARDGADAALKSAFLSRLFYCVQRGEDITLPVAEDSRTWLASVESVAAGFVHAALLPEIGTRRAFSLPALALRFGDLVAALQRRFPNSTARVHFSPDVDTVALFGSAPGLETATADALGFPRDADADALVRDAL